MSDTNLIAHLFIESVHTEAACAVYRCDPQWAAPLLWRSEFRNVLATYMKRGYIGVTEAASLQAKAEELMNGMEHHVLSHRILELVAETGCSAYDCEFVAVAESAGVQLVTSDKELLQSFPQIAKTPDQFVRSSA